MDGWGRASDGILGGGIASGWGRGGGAGRGAGGGGAGGGGGGGRGGRRYPRRRLSALRARDPREAGESGGSLQMTLNSCRDIYIVGECPCDATKPYNNTITYYICVLYCYRYVPVRCDGSKTFV
jgi:hypothetical protein